MLGPEPSDIHAATEPYAPVAFGVFEKLFEDLRQSRPAAGEVMHRVAKLHRVARALFVVGVEFILQLLQGGAVRAHLTLSQKGLEFEMREGRRR